MIITKEHHKQFKENGYFILDSIMNQNQLEILRKVSDEFVTDIEREMDETGRDVLNISHRGSRYFISNKYKEKQELEDFIFGDLMYEITSSILGENVYLFHEQFVVKAKEAGMKFGWHQDSGYIGHPHKPYLSCWIPLDDVNEENGSIYVLPYKRAGVRTMVGHEVEKGTNDKIGYTGDDPGIPVEVPAGSIVVFSSTLFHRSGMNSTAKQRRVYLPQYSSEPIMNKEGTELWGTADAFVKNGERVKAVLV